MPLQDGIYKISEGSDSEGRLASQVGLKGCVSNHSYPPFTLQIPENPIGRVTKVLPFRLTSVSCTFTKIMKPVVATLRRLGVQVVLYLDDMVVMSSCKSTAGST